MKTPDFSADQMAIIQAGHGKIHVIGNVISSEIRDVIDDEIKKYIKTVKLAHLYMISATTENKRIQYIET